jgi:hypothetical protein
MVHNNAMLDQTYIWLLTNTETVLDILRKLSIRH